jgi:ureidoacrylate peracid hydrolase
MMRIAGRTVCETVEELVAPQSTALVLIDFQNDYVAEGGVVNLRGEGHKAKTRKIIENTARVLECARRAGVSIVYLRYSRTRDHRYESPASLRWLVAKRGYSSDSVSAVEGTWGAEIVSVLAPKARDHVIDKRRSSGFFGTDLENVLRLRNIQTVILAGVSTHGCIESTARDAELRDFYVVVIEDCVGAYSDELHNAALTVMRSRYELVTSDVLVKIWSGVGTELSAGTNS